MESSEQRDVTTQVFTGTLYRASVGVQTWRRRSRVGGGSREGGTQENWEQVIALVQAGDDGNQSG